MKPRSIEFIYKAMNALASGKHDPEIEQSIADAIEHELLVLSTQSVLGRPSEMAASFGD